MAGSTAGQNFMTSLASGSHLTVVAKGPHIWVKINGVVGWYGQSTFNRTGRAYAGLRSDNSGDLFHNFAAN